MEFSILEPLGKYSKSGVLLFIQLHLIHLASPAQYQQNIITDAPNYPSDAIRQALMNAHVATRISQQESKPTGDQMPKKVLKVFGFVGVGNLTSDLGTPACEITTTPGASPLQLLDQNGNPQFVVNDPNLYSQKVFTQTCKYKNQPCGQIKEDLRANYESTCVETTIDVKMLAFINGAMKEESFKLPVSCDCYIKGFNLN